MTHIAPLLSLVLLSSLLSWTAAENAGTHQHSLFLGLPFFRWCGPGNSSISDNNLGIFAETDSCCREHDHCNHTIPAKQTRFGVDNDYWFTMSHCDCDNKFHSCLMQANESISDGLGHGYFNLGAVHCFEFTQKHPCEEFDMCNETEVAEVYPSMPYITPNRTEDSVNATLPEGGDDLMDTLPAENQTLPGLNITEEQLSCAVYNDLDVCSYKILPKQKKYGLYNPKDRTLYHCNCTSRVLQTVVKLLELTEEQTFLYRLFSLSCFLPHDCTAGKMKAVMGRAELPQKDH
ncbi:group 3 secretory phospholipase A2-like [Cebidichthys violaceus]|uniref:group 3 secretory phospholipase A2-like n=1 Tax=Cebidichthys violaceus TaxID=271503 RepID=UPI0035CC948C